MPASSIDLARPHAFGFSAARPAEAQTLKAGLMACRLPASLTPGLQALGPFSQGRLDLLT